MIDYGKNLLIVHHLHRGFVFLVRHPSITILISDKVIIWLNGIRQSLTRINVSFFLIIPAFKSLGFTRQNRMARVKSTYIKASIVPENIRCESGEIRIQERLAQLGASRVQKNENYLSAEQCRLTVSTARPNDDPHYSLTAGMRSVHTGLAIHVAFCTGL